jgi:hypothetical protein
LAEHLSFDLKDTAVSVHLLVPGWTFTGLVSSIVLFIAVCGTNGTDLRLVGWTSWIR